MSQAIALLTLLGLSGAAPPGEAKIATAETAQLLDGTVLVLSANMSALSGFLLAAVTPWGFFRNWWVLIKFAITVTQLYVGIGVLSPGMESVVEAAHAGEDGPVTPMATGAALMASALAFQAWLSIAKPGGRTPLGKRSTGRPRSMSAWLMLAGCAALLSDVALALVLRNPTPLSGLLVLALVLVLRRRDLARTGCRQGRPRRRIGPQPPGRR